MNNSQLLRFFPHCFELNDSIAILMNPNHYYPLSINYTQTQHLPYKKKLTTNFYFKYGINKREPKICFIYRKPTTTDHLINKISNHPFQHKMSTFLFLLN
ncbi:hypothetical protein C0J52_15558 [Blattella germanica]|nr:hypothetical protein C0J52_15558 [Blattella germanica]